MPRPIDPGAVVAGPASTGRRDVRTGRSTARAIAIAVALLLVSLLVVNGSRAALEDVPSAAAGTFSAGSVRLSDDDQGRSLIEVEGLVPGDREVECIEVTYEGDAEPVVVELSTSASGPLARSLLVQVEEGRGGGFGSCATFHSEGTIFEGTLAELSAGDPVEAFAVLESPDATSFRLTFTVATDARDTAGQATADFRWTASVE